MQKLTIFKALADYYLVGTLANRTLMPALSEINYMIKYLLSKEYKDYVEIFSTLKTSKWAAFSLYLKF